MRALVRYLKPSSFITLTTAVDNKTSQGFLHKLTERLHALEEDGAGAPEELESLFLFVDPESVL